MLAHHFRWRISGRSTCRQRRWTALNGRQSHPPCPGRSAHPNKSRACRGLAVQPGSVESGVRVPSAQQDQLGWSPGIRALRRSTLIMVDGLGRRHWSETGALVPRAPNGSSSMLQRPGAVSRSEGRIRPGLGHICGYRSGGRGLRSLLGVRRRWSLRILPATVHCGSRLFDETRSLGPHQRVPTRRVTHAS